MLNSRDINRLRPDVAANCRIFINLCKKAGYPVLVTGTVRDDEYQMQCYKRGTGGKPPATFHSVKAGLAFDVCKNIKGHEYDDKDFFFGVAEIAKKIGFSWGYSMWGYDMPHFQWDNHGKYSGSDIIRGNYPPQMPLYKEEEDMTKQEVKAIVEKALQAQKQPIWDKLEDVPEWGRATVEKLVNQGLIGGNKDGNLELNLDQLRVLVINDRAGMYGE